jgi:hypothetical protein
MDMSENLNPNKGKPIYYRDEKHFIVYEMNDSMLISKNKDLSKIFCVKKTQLSVKPNKTK